MHKLSPSTKAVLVRRLHLVATDDLVAKHTKGIVVQNKLHNYAVKYLERTYGVPVSYTHLTLPTKRIV